MDNKSTTKRMIGAVVLVLIAALLLAWLLKGKNKQAEQKDLIAEQTQESTPILGFPGVKNDQAQNGEGSLAAASSSTDPAAQQAAGANPNQDYAIGSTNAGGTTATGAAAATDPAQQQAAGVLGTQDPNASMPIADPNSATTQTAAAGTATGQTAAAGAGGIIASAVESGKQAIQGLTTPAADSTTDFQVRDSAAKDAAAGKAEPTAKGEVREVVENGQKKPGVGSMGANATTAAPAAGKTTGSESAPTKTAAAGSGAETGNKVASAGSNKPNATNGAANASTKDRPAVSSGELKPENPRLVNERPVPAPSAQPRNTASASTNERPASRPAAKPVEKPVPAAITTANAAASGYVIQVLATSDKAKADSIKTSMTGEGYPVFVASANVDGKTVYRVRVGTYPGKGDAAAVQARMKSRYAQNQYVQNSFVTKN